MKSRTLPGTTRDVTVSSIRRGCPTVPHLKPVSAAVEFRLLTLAANSWARLAIDNTRTGNARHV